MPVQIPILIEPPHAIAAAPRSKEPVTIGVPFPSGALVSEEQVALFNIDRADNAACPLQTRALDRWADGSIRWLLVDFQADAGRDGRARYRLEASDGAASTRPRPSSSIRIDSAGDGLLIEAGGARFSVGPGAIVPFLRVERAGRTVTEGAGFVVRDSHGRDWPIAIDRTVVEEAGPLRSVVRLEGAARGGRQPLVDVVMRLTCFAGSPSLRVAVTLRNRRRAVHKGGYWDLGDPGSVYLKDFSFVASLAGSAPATVRCSRELGGPLATASIPFEIYQDSSGGELWNSPAHVNREGRMPNTFRGYRLRSGGGEERGSRATPVVSIESDGASLAIAMEQFWQNFPKAIEVRDRELRLRLFPEQYGDVHELQAGEQKTHTFMVAFGRDDVSNQTFDWCRASLAARTDPDSYAASSALPRLTPLSQDPSPEYLALVQAALDGPSSFEAKREAIDEYGWRHFGDTYADHEAVGHEGPPPLVSHYNNQYDAVAGFARWYFRSGDVRWRQLMQDLAAHVVDIDIYHTANDKAAYNGGLFWHTFHYRDAGRATHRAYPRGAAGVPGGGPSAEHCYATGLMLHHFLTGDPASREAVLGLGEWILAADDGRRSRFRWFAGGATGLASSSGSPLYHGPGRGGANSIGVLVDCHRLTGDARYLEATEGLIRRSVHPEQDIDALHLGDVERRWFYTMFLQSLGKYLDHKSERGEHDAVFSYARESLLHFARWMAAHERPYLDRPEILEYPNETWAAQDLRKSEVFQFAALHADAAERARFLERAEFFFHSSVSTLMAKPTRTLTRPLVLLLNNGASRAWFQIHASASRIEAPAWPRDWRLEPFVPQKVTAMRRARALVALTGLAALISAALFLWR